MESEKCDPANEDIVIHKLSYKKKIIFYFVMLLFSLLIIEVGFKIYFAFRMGSSFLLPGKTEVSKQYRTVKSHREVMGGYSKYFPRQRIFDYDKVTGEMFLVTINSSGFRGTNYVKEKKPGVIRVVTLGASSTFGYYNRDKETYPYYMEQILNSKCKKAKSFEVINLGIPHMSTANMWPLFLDEAVPLNPDVITFYEGANDTQGGVSLKYRKSKILSIIREYVDDMSWAARKHLMFVKFFYTLYSRYLMSYTEKDFHVSVDGRSKRFLENMSKIYKECQKQGIKFIVANQQMKSLLIDEKEIKGITYRQEVEMLRKKISKGVLRGEFGLSLLIHSILMEDLRNWVSTNNIPFVDLIKATDQDRDVLLSWVHLSPKGNRIVAKAFAEKIIEETCPEGI